VNGTSIEASGHPISVVQLGMKFSTRASKEHPMRTHAERIVFAMIWFFMFFGPLLQVRAAWLAAALHAACRQDFSD
jgi:hypothetical protein